MPAPSPLSKEERDRRNAHHHEDQRQFDRRGNEDAQPRPEPDASSFAQQAALREFSDKRTNERADDNTWQPEE